MDRIWGRLFLYLVFLASGFAALIYQVVWQRSLYAIYGINVESVTMIVSAFMLGLGLGSLGGGAVSKDPKKPVLLMFSIVELVIGLFGYFSLDFFAAVGRATLGMSALGTGLITFVLVLVPTLMMGATLPLLVSYLVRYSKNVGKSVGTLYFVNTLGSALASAASVLILMPKEGQRGSVHIAAFFNLAVSALVFALHKATKSSESERSRSGATPPTPPTLAPSASLPDARTPTSTPTSTDDAEVAS
jgi:predicted membrane-bound spermidine synthase